MSKLPLFWANKFRELVEKERFNEDVIKKFIAFIDVEEKLLERKWGKKEERDT